MPREHAAHLCDLLGDIVSPIFDFWRNDGRLGCRRRVRLLFSPLREVECNQRDLVDGAVLVDVRIRGRAKQAGLHMIKRAWWVPWNTQRKFHLMQMHLLTEARRLWTNKAACKDTFVTYTLAQHTISTSVFTIKPAKVHLFLFGC